MPRWTSSAPVELALSHQTSRPVLTVDSPGAEGIKYGFEGGRVVKVGAAYHLFTSEMAGDPFWVKMRLGYWRSDTGLEWERLGTLFESSGDQSGADPRAALWSPMPVFDSAAQRWNLFYVAYTSKPSTEKQWLDNHAGRIWRAVSLSSGLGGIAGPYENVGIVLEPGPGSDPWEGLQGTASFFPYEAAEGWLALYGSARSEELPIRQWQVGLAHARGLGGPWTRCSQSNPLAIEPVFIENPVVERLLDGSYLAVYDTHAPNAIGFTHSLNGATWSSGSSFVVQPGGQGAWADDVRTPLGLVREADGSYTLFYTGYHRYTRHDGRTVDAGWWKGSVSSIGRVRLRVEAR